MNRSRRRLALGLLIVAIVAVGAALAAQAGGLLRSAEQRTVAQRFAVRGAQPPADVAVIAIDDDSLAQLQQRWPLPRSRHAEMLRVLHRAGVREVVYDVQFTEPTRPREDLALYDALGDTGGAVLATTTSRDDGGTNVLGGDENLARVGSVAAAANFPDGAGGTLERFPRAVGKLSSLAVTAAVRAGGPQLPASAFADGGAPIDFRGPP